MSDLKLLDPNNSGDSYDAYEIDLNYEYPIETYIEKFYFITTTMTTVGYGEINAFNPAAYSMLSMSFILFLGMLEFSDMKEGIFSLKSYTTILQILDQAESTTKEVLANVEKTVKKQS